MLFNRKASGFTLIELVIGIVVLSLSFSIIFTMILPTATQSAVQIHQVRAAELGQAMMNEIMGKAFDEHSDMMGGMNRCGEGKDTNLDDVIDACTLNDNLGPDTGETNRSLYNDVDDYNNYSTIEDSLNDNSDDDLDTLYRGFSVNVSVCNDSNYDDVCDTTNNIAKLIKVTVTNAEGEAITFASYKANF
ncbi:type IV pilus modification PilV family protein [Pseudocolwellia agarivorans]|uniref:type IV pilus modification PilV family protein n=1 Tax=Pseudocolwellia agarivorans TaxID=1911682 RepID=UPI000985B97B|nr:type II secretion system protein [Pseudocolwellia agarivorans]